MTLEQLQAPSVISDPNFVLEHHGFEFNLDTRRWEYTLCGDVVEYVITASGLWFHRDETTHDVRTFRSFDRLAEFIEEY